jgi:hypothetical protein
MHSDAGLECTVEGSDGWKSAEIIRSEAARKLVKKLLSSGRAEG